MIKTSVVASEQRKVRDLTVDRFFCPDHRIMCPTNLTLTEYTAPTVVGSHMSLLRPTTPRLSGDRRNGKPGEVSFSAYANFRPVLNDHVGLRSLRNQRRAFSSADLRWLRIWLPPELLRPSCQDQSASRLALPTLSRWHRRFRFRRRRYLFSATISGQGPPLQRQLL